MIALNFTHSSMLQILTNSLSPSVVVSTVHVHVLAAIPGVPEIVAGTIPYIERHFDRLDRLHASSYLFDFALSSLGAIEISNDQAIDEYGKWKVAAKLALPPNKVDGRVDIGGNAVVGGLSEFNYNRDVIMNTREDDDESNELVTIGGSDESEEE
jgi:Utp13 specific WD40 associated domain